MRVRSVLVTGLIAGIGFSAGAGLAQTRTLSDTECRALRDRLAEHARLSDGVRRDLASRAPALPATQPPPSAPAPAPAGGRAEAIRARLEKIPEERERLEDARLASYLRFDLGRAAQLAQQVQALDTEKANLEKELAGLPATPPGALPSPAAPAGPAPGTASGADRISCQNLPAALDAAVTIRQRELGAREGQPGVVPLAALKGQSPDQVAQELAGQFAGWPATATQVGLLDQDGNGRLDAFVDAPAPNVLRLYRQRADGTVSIDAFPIPGRTGDPTYGEMTRRIEEATVRQTGRTFADLLAARPAGPMRVLGETGDFARAHAAFLAGNFADAARIEAGAARSIEFQNLRGETLRVLEVLAPATGGVILGRIVVMPRPNTEELWDETTTLVRPTSYWHTDVEVRRATERRSSAGSSLAPRSTSGPFSFGVDR